MGKSSEMLKVESQLSYAVRRGEASLDHEMIETGRICVRTGRSAKLWYLGGDRGWLGLWHPDLMVSADGPFQTKLILQKAPLPSVPPELPQPDKRAGPVVAGNNGLTAPNLLPPWPVVQFPSTAFSKLWTEILVEEVHGTRCRGPPQSSDHQNGREL
ncbi:predicted protein [Verticillium alfalfae VaMs.102]|uniref:Predicted protein n=1 Tax=Verticillium alfalfae (strain VaMs.102 / ATCC MYA-4576 / FGSC 10136) TaxID=526221 RepID=C9SBY2_VERA1|nr:predicted protein [Verticillium alfalfae VaMs.102]EEY15866.1 predicted protein [Verticillium alfalfae VaMs.102]